MKVRQISKFTALALSVIAAVSMTAGCSKQSAGPGAGAAAAAAHAVPVNVVTVEPHPVQVQEQISGRTVSYRIVATPAALKEVEMALDSLGVYYERSDG